MFVHIVVCSVANVLVVLATSPAACVPTVQVVQVQDATATFSEHMKNMSQLTPLLFEALNSKFPNFSYGLTTFTDKGAPFLGFSNSFGSWQNIQEDYCLNVNQPLTTDSEKLSAALSETICSGGNDLEEAQLEALLRTVLSPDVGWSDERTTDEGQPIVKLAILISDGFPHLQGDAKLAADYWNENYGRSKGVINQINYTNADAYREWVGLRNSSNPDTNKLHELDELFAPLTWPEPKPAAYDSSLNDMDCKFSEYPDVFLTQFSEAIKIRGVTPLAIIIQPVDETKFGSPDCSDECWWYSSTSTKLAYQRKYCPNMSIDVAPFYTSCLLYFYKNAFAPFGYSDLSVVLESGVSTTELVELIGRIVFDASGSIGCGVPIPSFRPMTIPWQPGVTSKTKITEKLTTLQKTITTSSETTQTKITPTQTRTIVTAATTTGDAFITTAGNTATKATAATTTRDAFITTAGNTATKATAAFTTRDAFITTAGNTATKATAATTTRDAFITTAGNTATKSTAATATTDALLTTTVKTATTKSKEGPTTKDAFITTVNTARTIATSATTTPTTARGASITTTVNTARTIATSATTTKGALITTTINTATTKSTAVIMRSTPPTTATTTAIARRSTSKQFQESGRASSQVQGSSKKATSSEVWPTGFVTSTTEPADKSALLPALVGSLVGVGVLCGVVFWLVSTFRAPPTAATPPNIAMMEGTGNPLFQRDQLQVPTSDMFV